MSNSTIIVPNPYAQLAWVPPELAPMLSSKLYSGAGTLAVLWWDIIVHASLDFKMLKTCRINFLTIVYVFARISTLAYMMLYIIAISAPIGNCELIRYVSFLLPFTMPISILHFVFRVSALYKNSKLVFGFFSLTWLSVFATTLFWPFRVKGVPMGPTKYCFEERPIAAISSGAICLLIHDFLIFAATSWAFMSHSYMEQNVKGKLKVAFLGENLPKFTKSMLRDGQGYYLASSVAHLIFVSRCFSPTPFVYPCAIGMPAIIMTTTMSPHVYRNIRLGFYDDFTNSNPMLYQTNRQQESNVSPYRPQEPPLAFCRNSDIESRLSGSDSGSEEGEQDKHDVAIDIDPGHSLDSEEVEKQTEVEIVEKI